MSEGKKFIGFLDDEAATSISGHRDMELDQCMKEVLNKPEGVLARLYIQGDPEVRNAIRDHLNRIAKELPKPSPYAQFRMQLRQLLSDHGITSNPGWSDADIVDAFSEKLNEGRAS